MKKKFISDIMLNLISTFILFGAIQLIIFPILSRQIDITMYGNIVALYGFNNIIINFLGNTLNNIRLLQDKNAYNKGVFNWLLYIICVLSIPIALLLYIPYSGHIGFLDLFILAIATLLGNIRMYSLAFYRINLSYINIFLCNVFIVFGYLLGLFLFIKVYHVFSIIFLIGELLAVCFIWKTTPINQEKAVMVNEDKKIISDFSKLSFSNFMANIIVYWDRFIIIPILGAPSLTIYYSATVISKMLSMIVNPITNVLLSYVANSSEEFFKKKIRKILILCAIAMCFFLIALEIISPYVITLLYPRYATEAIKFLTLTNIATVFLLFGNIVNPFLLRFTHMKAQVVIQILFAIATVVCTLLGIFIGGLYGFCFGICISNLFKLLIMIVYLLKVTK